MYHQLPSFCILSETDKQRLFHQFVHQKSPTNQSLLVYIADGLLGSALMIGNNLLPVFEQLEIEKEFIALGKPTMDCSIYKVDKGVPVHQTTVSFQPHIG
jgi:hypothetical protein